MDAGCLIVAVAQVVRHEGDEPAALARRVYVANPGPNGTINSITIYTRGANGNVTPTTTIGGPNRLGDRVTAIARDAQGNLYLTNPYEAAVTVYGPGATGNATPLATIHTWTPTNPTGDPEGITVDAAGNLYVTNAQYRSGPVYPNVAVIPPGVTAPARTISGSNTGMNSPGAIARDAEGNLYVANRGLSCCGVANSITVYAADASGNTPPIATIAGSLTGLTDPRGLALDSGGNLYVANYAADSITVNLPGARGNVAPFATIAGASTGLDGPAGIAFDASGTLYVANATGNSITGYLPGARGNVAPGVTIAGGITGPNYPVGVAF